MGSNTIFDVRAGQDFGYGTFIKNSNSDQKSSPVNLKLNEIKEVIFSERRFNSRTPTAHLSYTKLIFQNNEHLLITSFLLNTKEMKGLLGKGNYKETFRTRGLFEAIIQKGLPIEH